MQPSPLALLQLAWRQLRRERHSSELRVLAMALLIAVCACTAIGSFSQRLHHAMQARAGEFLAGDIVLRGSAPASAEQIAAGQALQHARSVEFVSMLGSDAGMQLTSVKAVEAPYPLRGTLRSRSAEDGPTQEGSLPAAGEAWAEPRLLATLGLRLGDSIEVGYQRLQLTRLLDYEPDRAGDFYSLMPRLLINLGDLQATGIIQPGSRVLYREHWRGDDAALAQYRRSVTPTLAAHQSLQDTRDGNQQLGDTLERATRYINLATLVAVLLAGVAVALAASRFAARRLDMAALLRCFGLDRRRALLLFLLQLLLLGLLACSAGALLGLLAQHGLSLLLSDLLPADLPPANLQPALAGMATGLVALTGFALPPLLGLGRVPPLRVLRRDLLPLPMSALLIHGCALLALLLVMWWLSLDLTLTLALLGGGALACLLLGGLCLLLLRALRRLLADAGPAWRLGLGQLLRHPLAAVGQMLAFGLILLAMGLILLLRGELLDDWQQQLPADAPNHFVINLLPEQREPFSQQLQALGVKVPPLYPLLPGRLVSLNGEPLAGRQLQDTRSQRTLQRDLNLTWSEQLPEDNRLSAGTWWPDAPAGRLPRASLEQRLATSLGARVGDRLGFSLAGQPLEVEISSIRTVNWNSFHPNFFVIFEPSAMRNQSATWMTSFYLPPSQPQAARQLLQAFPNITLLPIDALLGQIRSIVAQVSLAVEYVLLFVLAAGLSVLFAGLQATLDERQQQGALLRTLGARRQLLLSARLREFGLLGAASGLLAAIGCELILALLYRLVLDLPLQLHSTALLLPPAGALLIGCAGLWATRRVLDSSPLQILREG